MTQRLLKTLILAGTAEARAVIDGLVVDGRFDIMASLAGATPNPAVLPVATVNGGFGGADGLARFCCDQGIDLLIDVTHPFARHISRNARLAASETGVPLLRFERPPWQPMQDDDWRSFTSWQEMADAIPAGSRVFLAGGTQSIEIFTKRLDFTLLARALNVEGRTGPSNVTFINALPATSVEAERRQFVEAGITLICCKNSGGAASFAKIAAARELGLPVWLLARHSDAVDADPDRDPDAERNRQANLEILDSVDAILAAAVSRVDRQSAG